MSSMDAKVHQGVTNLPKAEVGEIDTRAPFESVKAAVSLFGEGAFPNERQNMRKGRSPPKERTLAKKPELQLAGEELRKLKELLNNTETSRAEALAELNRSRNVVEDLTNKLNITNRSKKLAVHAADAVKGESKQFEETESTESIGVSGPWKNELDGAREQFVIAISELDGSKQDLRRMRKNFEIAMDAKLLAFQREAEAKQLSDASTKKASQLPSEIAAVQESLTHAKLALLQAQHEESEIFSAKGASRQCYKQALEEKEKKLVSLKKELDPALHRILKADISETIGKVEAVKNEMELARTSDIEAVTAVRTELGGAKEVLHKVTEEENSLRSLMESLKLELDAIVKEHSEVKEKEAEVESIAGELQVKLQKFKAELEPAVIVEAKAASACNDLMSTLTQLSLESETAKENAATMENNSKELRMEAEAARILLVEVEEKLQGAMKDAETAKAAEARAVDQNKILSEKANAARASSTGPEASITISTEEYESLTKKVEEREKVTEMKLAAALAQVEAIKASENEAITRLEAISMEIEDVEIAMEAALQRAQMAEAARTAVQVELKRWRERKQKKATEPAAQMLTETRIN